MSVRSSTEIASTKYTSHNGTGVNARFFSTVLSARYKGIPETKKANVEIRVHVKKFDQEFVDSGVISTPSTMAIGAEMQ
jgi:hypothetical protein